MSTNDQLPPGKPLLAIAHPGHEIRVHHWLELAAPDVAVLTDGSGHGGQPRLKRTTELLARAGANPVQVYGAMTDRRLYDAILFGNVALLADVTREIANLIVAGRYDYVLGDAAQNIKPAHDVFRAMLDAAVELARRQTCRTILNMDFPVEGRSDSVHPLLRSRTYVLELDGAALKRKVAAACDFAASGSELDVVLHKLGAWGARFECLRPAMTEAGLADVDSTAAWELQADQAGVVTGYDQAMRYLAHVRPLLEKLHAALGLADTQFTCAA